MAAVFAPPSGPSGPSSTPSSPPRRSLAASVAAAASGASATVLALAGVGAVVYLLAARRIDQTTGSALLGGLFGGGVHAAGVSIGSRAASG